METSEPQQIMMFERSEQGGGAEHHTNVYPFLFTRPRRACVGARRSRRAGRRTAFWPDVLVHGEHHTTS